MSRVHNNRSADLRRRHLYNGLAAIAIKMFGMKNAADNPPASNLSRLLRKTTEQAKSYRTQRRNQDVNEHAGETAGSVTRGMA